LLVILYPRYIFPHKGYLPIELISKDGNHVLYPEYCKSDSEIQGPHYQNVTHWKTPDFAAILPVTDDLLKKFPGIFAEYPVIRFMLLGCVSKLLNYLCIGLI
jgi:hypothetical protein